MCEMAMSPTCTLFLVFSVTCLIVSLASFEAYHIHATNRAHLTLIFLFFEVGTAIFQFWFLN